MRCKYVDEAENKFYFYCDEVEYRRSEKKYGNN